MFIEVMLSVSEIPMYVRIESITHVIKSNARAKIYIQGRELPYMTTSSYEEIVDQINNATRGKNEPR